MSTSDHPPAFEPAGSIELQSLVDSKIIGVSLYSNRAEITRVYKFTVKTGQNQVNISGLPNILEAESLRVEGRGAATIHDVTVSTAKGEHVPTSSPALAALLRKREKTSNALARCNKSITSLEQYLSSLTVEYLDVSKLDSVMEQYDSTGDRLDAKKSELTEELRIIDLDITAERTRIAVPHENDKLRVKAAIGVFAQAAGDVEIALIYAVPCANWTAFYDIRVDMSTKEDPITLIYKAAITQNTGEAWDDVPLTLETSTPTFGLGIPELAPWNLDVQRFAELKKSKSRRGGFPGSSDLLSSGLMSSSSYRDRELSSRRRESMSAEADGIFDEPMGFGGASVTSKGNFSATFRVPGMVSIPTDGEAHNFTIVQLNLKADMSWVCVPKVDTKAHITARITNASEYALLAGTASVYVDGSFISRSDIPSVSPKESFDCPLGVDPSIRITYHPVIKNLSQSGFYTKSANYVFSQRVSIFNTKASAIERLKIIDQIPTSQNSQIEVKLVNPALTVPTKDTSAGMNTINLKAAAAKATPQIVTVARGVVAQWDGVDEPDCAVETLGLDRKLNWVCSVGAQAKINLTLDWEVSVSPASARIQGL
ncbi:hypothetical protein B0H16DRAFT_1623171 [Mycena metata]|uniref:Mucoidy inhibitor A n=1 Tax=Mycena metata TaxID=1033252 RepID=A0AAD7H5P7_9AGAR|nr:hypothetical protein B0H16DRAFT_1623171 [Mycena metata]